MTTSIGQILKERRKELKLGIDDIAATTKISGKYIRAIEADEFQKIPGEAYAKGFINIYATTLGLDGAVLVGQYKRDSGKEPAEASPDDQAAPVPEEVLTRDLVKPPRSLWVALAVVAAIVIGAFAYFGWLRSTPESKPPQPKPIIAPQDSTPKEPADADTITDPATQTAPPVSAAGAVTLKITIIGSDCWIDSIKVDGVEEFSGTLKVGETREYKAAKTIYVSAPYGHRIAAVYNGQDIGPLNPAAEAVHKTFTPQGVQEGEVRPQP